MAKLTITIEDLPNGRVKAVMDPPGFQIAKMIVSGEPTTSAHALALCALNAILKEQKAQERGKIIVPKLLT